MYTAILENQLFYNPVHHDNITGLIILNYNLLL